MLFVYRFTDLLNTLPIASLAWVLPKDELLKMWPVIRNMERLHAGEHEGPRCDGSEASVFENKTEFATCFIFL